jgi:hypothetical protein
MLALFLVDQLSGVPLFDDLQAAEPIRVSDTIALEDDQDLARLPGEAELERRSYL